MRTIVEDIGRHARRYAGNRTALEARSNMVPGRVANLVPFSVWRWMAYLRATTMLVNPSLRVLCSSAPQCAFCFPDAMDSSGNSLNRRY
jgi:hypothetical protein